MQLLVIHKKALHMQGPYVCKSGVWQLRSAERYVWYELSGSYGSWGYVVARADFFLPCFILGYQ